VGNAECVAEIRNEA